MALYRSSRSMKRRCAMLFSPSNSHLVWFTLVNRDKDLTYPWEELRFTLYPLWVQVSVTDEDPAIMDNILLTIFNTASDKDDIECAMSELQYFDWDEDIEEHRQQILQAAEHNPVTLTHIALHMLHQLKLKEQEILEGIPTEDDD